MPAHDYGDLSRLALEADLDPDELRARLARMSARALLEFGRAAAYMCTPYANLGQQPRKPFVLLQFPGCIWSGLVNDVDETGRVEIMTEDHVLLDVFASDLTERSEPANERAAHPQ